MDYECLSSIRQMELLHQLIVTSQMHRAFKVAHWLRIHLSTEERQETQVQSLGREDALQKEMATHSSILGGKSHGQPGWLQSIGWAESDTTEQLSTHALRCITCFCPIIIYSCFYLGTGLFSIFCFPHSSILAWRIPWTEEGGKLQPVESQSRTLLCDFHFHTLICEERNGDLGKAVDQWVK